MRLWRTLLGATLVAVVAAAALLLPAPLAAQGITTAAISGCVTDEQGNPIGNIAVTVTNESTGFVSGALTGADCRYFVQGLQIGGPYVVEASGLGYAPESERVTRLTLGQRRSLDFTLRQEAIEVAAITVVNPTAAQLINPNRTGQVTLITENQIANLPTISRNFTDFVSLSPLSGSGGNFTALANQNNRFNNIQIDGVVTQDLFGLGATGQPGGQAGARSISIEAVKEYQIIAAPFDVRQAGFTGGLINAVTKTGTNEWKGSAYAYFRSDKLVRDKLQVGAEEIEFGDFDNRIMGATVSGPLMKDRVHFFGSFETEGDERPGGEVALGRDPETTVHLTQSDASRVATRLEELGVDPGGTGPFTVENPNRNVFGRIDAQLADNHILTARHNYVRAEDDVVQNRFGGSIYSFDSNFYFFETTTNSFVTTLNSTFGNSGYNEATFGYTRIRDRRTPRVRYPVLDIRGVPDPDGTGTTTVRVGAEEFSQANELDQDSWEFIDNLSFTLDDHRITVGVQDQIFKFRNLFLPTSTGVWTFNNLDDFESGTPSAFRRTVLVEGVDDPNARFTINNVSLYGQTEWTGIDNVVLTAGLRYDVPLILDDPLRNPDVEAAFGRRTDEMPSGNGILSPRFGFNWDVGGEGLTQVRGGAGLFTGRHPFVWLSNVFSNTGRFSVSINCTGAALPAFAIEPGAQPGTCLAQDVPDPPRPVVNLVDPDFEFPSAWRFDVGVDHTLPWNVVGTAEFLYTKYRKQIFLRELNVDFANPVSTTQGGRPVFGTHKDGLDTGANNDIATANRFSDAFWQVVELTNSDEDWAWSFILQAQKRYSDGFELNAAYTISDAEDVSGLTSSIATSNIGFNPVGLTSPNDTPLATSDYLQRHKFSIGATWEPIPWLAWSIGYVANSGDRYAYTIDGDVNADGYEFFTASNRNNDLVYVPTGPDDITLLDPDDWDTLNTYIETEDCLRENRGRVMPRNVCEEPWRHNVTTRFTFKVPTVSQQHAELTLDIFNLGNLLSEDWGRNRGVEFATIELLELRGWDTANNRGIFDLDDVELNESGTAADPLTTFDVSSRWQMQIGVRYEVD